MRQGINIYIPLETLRELDRLAQEKGKSRGAVIQELVMGARDAEVSTQDVADCMEKAMAKLPVRMGPSDERIDSAEEGS